MMCDFKLSVKDEREKNLFNLLAQARQNTSDRVREPKGQEIETMTYFLSSEFAALMDNKQAIEDKKKNEDKKPVATQSSQAYKSQFLKDKLVQ